ncbi:MAG: aldo/keto reductase [Lachnospiraceae bacterium]|nr:aldo/keto reductase [Lachnospiraceae bacterium]
MVKVTLGSTGITVNKNGFGALPIQRLSMENAVQLLKKAYENGIDYFDTARVYSDSEQKIGAALSSVREKIYIATKTQALTGEALERDLATSLEMLRTDYIDVYQMHNPPFCPGPGDDSGLYDAALRAKKEGKIRHIGFTNHRLFVAKEAIESGLYKTLQFPFSYLAGEQEKELVALCKEKNMGFVAMKALSGGLITDSAAAYAYLAQFDNVLPIWGVQRERELNEFLSYIEDPPILNEAMEETIRKDREELSGDFCRGCGYCMPCPVGIEINNCARISLMLRRAPSKDWLTEEWQKKMSLIEKCLHCNNCKRKCPYSLDTPELLKKNLEDYRKVVAGEVSVGV